MIMRMHCVSEWVWKLHQLCMRLFSFWNNKLTYWYDEWVFRIWLLNCADVPSSPLASSPSPSAYQTARINANKSSQPSNGNDDLSDSDSSDNDNFYDAEEWTRWGVNIFTMLMDLKKLLYLHKLQRVIGYAVVVSLNLIEFSRFR